MKIQKIILNNFRGFPGPENFEFNLKGKNLLLFGENGSGKSSLYRALVELFQPYNPTKTFADFRHAFTVDGNGQPLNTGLVRVEFDTPARTPLTAEWSETQSRTPLLKGAAPELDLTARSLGCLDYRAMLETNFVHRSGRVNLFPLIVYSLLRHTQVVTGATRSTPLGDLWHTVLTSKPSSHRGSSWKVNVAHAAGVWNSNFAPLIVNLTHGTNRLLQFFDSSGMTVNLHPAALAYSTGSRQFEGREVWLDVSLHGKLLAEPQHFLNEARLSALALALFLAGYQLNSSAPLAGGPDYARVLILDDVLIGLDYANRFPLLKLLDDQFHDWQVLLFTHDSIWFEMAKEFTEDGKRWKYTQIRGIHDAGGGVAFPQVHEDPKDDITVASQHLAAGDRKAAAVYARSAFESKLRSICSKNSIKVQYKSNPKDVSAESLWAGIKSKNADLLAEGKPLLVEAGLVNQIEAVRSVVLNKLSHSQLSTLTTAELTTAIRLVQTLCQNH